MGKRSSKEISRIVERGSNAWQQLCQEALDALERGEFERVANFLGKIETENLPFDQTYLIGVANQICLACIRSKVEIAWHLQAQKEADERVNEFQQQLSTILNLIGTPEIPQVRVPPGQIPRFDLVPATSLETQNSHRQKHHGLWQRVRALFGSIPPPLADEKATPNLPTVREHSLEAHLPIPEVEEPASLLPTNEGASGQDRPSLIIYCLGPFRVYQMEKEITEWHSFKGRDIFKYMLARRETPIAKDILIDVFWPDADPKAARRNLHQTIYSLRQTLRGEQPKFHHIWFENDCYFLNPQMDIWLDFIEFEKCAQAGLHFEKTGHIGEAIDRYGTAEGLYQGDFLEEDLYEDWPTTQREQLRNLYLSVVDRLCELHFQNRQYAAVAPLCQKILAKDKCYEAAHRWLMQCFMAYGQRHLAVRQYQTCIQALKEELDILPSEETVVVYRRLLSNGEA